MTNDSQPSDSRLRLRALLDTQFAVALVVLLAVAAGGAGLTYAAYVDPDVETNEQTVDSWGVESEHVHSATVTEENSIFPVGTELTDRDTYFTRVAPELDVDVVTSYTASSGEDVTIDAQSMLVVENVDGGTVYWEETESLGEVSETDVGPGENATVSFTLNATAVDDRVSDIESELGAAPGDTNTEVRTDVTLSGIVNGENVEHDRTLTLSLTAGGDTYSVEDPGVQSDTMERTETVETTREYGPLYTIGGPLLLVVGLAGAGALGYGRREERFALSETERAYLDYRDDRSEFGEWITRIQLPDGAFDRPEATAESLADLVEFAIDNDAGVVEDPRTGAFHAVVGGTLYTYQPPERPASPASPASISEDSPETADGDGDEDGDGDRNGDRGNDPFTTDAGVVADSETGNPPPTDGAAGTNENDASASRRRE